MEMEGAVPSLDGVSVAPSSESVDFKEEDVTIRRNSQALRHNRHREGTATTVVSEAFAFLSQTPSMCMDGLDEESNDRTGGGQVYSNVTFNGEVPKWCGEEGIESLDMKYVPETSSLETSGIYGVKEHDKVFIGLQSKDSGFASLERQGCVDSVSSAYEKFAEQDDDDSEDLSMQDSAVYDNNVNSNGASDVLGGSGHGEDDVYDDVVMPSACSATSKSANVEDKSGGDVIEKTDSKENSLSSIGTRDTSGPPDKEGIAASYENYKGPVDLVSGPTDNLNAKSIQIPLPGAQNSDQFTKDISGSPEHCYEIPVSNSGYSHGKVSTEGLHQANDENLYERVIKPDVPTKDETAKDNDENIASIAAIAVPSSSEDEDDNEEDDKLVEEVTLAANGSEEIYDTVDWEKTNNLQTESFPVRDEQSVAMSEKSASLINGDLYEEVGNLEQTNGEISKNTQSVSCVDTPDVCSSQGESASKQGESQVTTEANKDSSVNVTRRPKLEKNPSVEICSDDSSDEDVGIYAESFRRSNWIRVSQEGKLELRMPSSKTTDSTSSSPLSSTTSTPKHQNSLSDNDPLSPRDDVFNDPLSLAAAEVKKLHKRSDSINTTASENEFKREYVSRRKCLIQRADSRQEYHRLSARVYDQDKLVVVERTSGCDDIGLHLLNSHPAFITSVDPDSAAAKAGVCEGQILVSINDQNVLTTDHADIVELIKNSKGSIKLAVANSDFQPVRDLQASVMAGYIYKLGNSSFMKTWKKRYFVLRQDNCLYYYKNNVEHDPLGAIPLGGYTISRHTDTSKDFCFKAEKYRARTYYFMTDNRDQLTEWVCALTEAAARSKKRKESFLSVSSHNVSLPALDIRRPECSGFLGKISPSRRNWRRRYCVLKDACVYYYKDVNSLSALGVAHLHGYKVDVENLSRRKFSFSLQPPEKGMRVFCFSADNDTDKKRWVESLIHSIQRWVRVDKEAEC